MIMILFSGTQAMAKTKGVIYTAAILGLLGVLGFFFMILTTKESVYNFFVRKIEGRPVTTK